MIDLFITILNTATEIPRHTRTAFVSSYHDCIHSLGDQPAIYAISVVSFQSAFFFRCRVWSLGNKDPLTPNELVCIYQNVIVHRFILLLETFKSDSEIAIAPPLDKL